MYSEGVEADFFRHVDLIKPEFIVVRDMFLDETLKRTKSLEEDIQSLHEGVDEEMVSDYETFVGSIKTYKYLIQLIFKARFKANWETELHDDYFAINKDTLLYVIELLGYEISYEEEYTLPFLKTHAAKKYDIDLSFPTHFKLIAKRKMEASIEK